MRLSQLFGKTLRQDPGEVDTPSHRLLLKAGMLHQLASGVYSYLPLAWRALRKLEAIIREEMDAAGGQEVNLPVLQPIEMWEETGRRQAFGDSLFTLKDRRGRELCLGPTHEEVITELVKRNVSSYRDLPLLVYQIQTKFRDELRPRGGLLRVREFIMKDLYSFDAGDAGLEESYRKMVKAYENIYARCGLQAVMVEADSGAIGGKDSHEFMVLTPTGEDTVLLCPEGDYAANAEKAQGVKKPLPKEKTLPLEEVATPGVETIEGLARFLDIPREKTLKAVFYSSDGELVLVTIRGDLEVNEVKLKNALKRVEMRLATEEEVARAGLVAGSASARGLDNIKKVADDSILLGANFVIGANRSGFHLRHANYPRDFQADLIADIALAQAGQGCPRCGALLNSTQAIEVGHIFKLGTFFSERLGAYYLDPEGRRQLILMGCYGIGLGRLLAAAVEYSHDERGIVWPLPLAPYQVHLVALGMDRADVASAAEELYQRLQKAGLEVLYDDRPESPGVKFNDADLLGMPLRVTLSQRTLKQGCAEVKPRRGGEAQLVPLETLPSYLSSLLVDL